MSLHLPSEVHASLPISPDHLPPPNIAEDHCIQLADLASTEIHSAQRDYLSRAQWLRAAVLGANDGLVSTASIMIGVGAVNQTSKAMLVSGLAGLVAGALSMAIGEFVSVFVQYDMEVAHMERDNKAKESKKGSLPSPFRAAGASALAFAIGAILPLMASGFIRPWGVRIGMVCGVTSLGLAGFGAVSALLGGSKVVKSAVRMLICGWVAMAVSYGVLKLFGLARGTQVSTSA